MGYGETIEGLAERTGVAPSTIRMYQHIGILDPPRRVGRIGIYNNAHVSRIETILHLKEMGFSLSGIRALLEPEAREKVLKAVRGKGEDHEDSSTETGAPARVLGALDDGESPLHRLLDIPEEEFGTTTLEQYDLVRLANEIDITKEDLANELKYLRHTSDDLAEHYWELLRLDTLEPKPGDDPSQNGQTEIIAFWIVLLRRAIGVSFDRALQRRLARMEGETPPN